LANGIIRTWSEDGRLIRAVRYKKGELIEVIRD
jgi:antitoxin component YwqK of YwqJK toxin-antitoxin module